MPNFIDDVLNDVLSKKHKLEDLVFVLPSRRAGGFLFKRIAGKTNQTSFAPQIFSIEEFVCHISDLRVLSSIELVMEFYKVYKKNTPKDKQDEFIAFLGWANVVLSDINEIDRFLLDSDSVFSYLNEIQEVNHWSKSKNSELVANHLRFWKSLPEYYTFLRKSLSQKRAGYQGLIYRSATEALEYYLNSNANKHHVFLGFNALNAAEENIIKTILHTGNASIYWDSESVFMETKYHDASLFLNNHKSTWNFFQDHPFNWIKNNYVDTKEINIIKASSAIAQAKYVGEIIKNLSKSELNSTAVILADETLITPLLSSLPENILEVNVTMGLPINNSPLGSFYNAFLSLHKNHKNFAFYYADLEKLLNNAYCKNLLHNLGDFIFSYLKKNNTPFISSKEIIQINPNKALARALELLFKPLGSELPNIIYRLIELNQVFKEMYLEHSNKLQLEYLYGFDKVLQKLSTLLNDIEIEGDIAVFHTLLNQIIDTEVITLKGNPNEGLQIIGVLESRLLDFKNVIITSVNEGVLPAGKSYNSFIPYDLKLEMGLPTYKDKDAVYTYHFYRLLHRAEKIDILYTLSNTGLTSSEKSRFILQLENEGVHKLNYINASIPITEKNEDVIVQKTNAVQKLLKEYLQRGISPSAIALYLKNPLLFYHRYILKIKEDVTMEETIAANTMGTVIHNVLEKLYDPFLGTILLEKNIKNMLESADELVKSEFLTIYKQNTFIGKNLIIYEVTKRYISNILTSELFLIQKGNEIVIESLEKKLLCTLSDDTLPYDIKLEGTVDRIDKINLSHRIIDYKTGAVESSKLKIEDWSDLLTEEGKYEKALQLMIYSYLYNKTSILAEKEFKAGIISLKRIKKGFMPFMHQKSDIINNTLLGDFEKTLFQIINEIIDPSVPFKDSGFRY